MKFSVHTYPLLLVLCCLFCGKTIAQQSQLFASLLEVLAYANTKNYMFQNANLQAEVAAITRTAAIGNIFSPRVLITAQILNNTHLQTSFLPAEAFDEQLGTFKESDY